MSRNGPERPGSTCPIPGCFGGSFLALAMTSRRARILPHIRAQPPIVSRAPLLEDDMRAHHRTTVYTPSLIWAAYHEAGHAVATVLAFRTAPWLPRPALRLPVQYIEIREDGT